MNAQWIDIPSNDGHTFSGYLSLPPTGHGPAIVLVQEIWGVNEHIRAVADQYALAGYVVLAPDIFWRMQARVDLDYDEAGTKQAFGYYQTINAAQAADDVAAAVAWLRQRPEANGKVATLGYCLGGRLAFMAAALSQADAAVCFYGGGIEQQLHLAGQITQPILFHYAADDQHIPHSAVAAVKQAFSGKSNAHFFDYPGVGHGFNCWGRQAAYNQSAASLATGRTLCFLAEQL